MFSLFKNAPLHFVSKVILHATTYFIQEWEEAVRIRVFTSDKTFVLSLRHNTHQGGGLPQRKPLSPENVVTNATLYIYTLNRTTFKQKVIYRLKMAAKLLIFADRHFDFGGNS